MKYKNNKKNEIMGNVFDIQRFSLHDGPGIRTTVFLKGCPLRCVWCHNPESQSMNIDLSYDPKLCIGCGNCIKLCDYGCHVIEDGVHIFDRTNCSNCLKCTEQCFSGALKKIGRHMTVDEVMYEVLKDAKYYHSSSGGITLSGGEPMAQYQFTGLLLEAAKKNNIHTCMETCGYTRMKNLNTLRENVDIFLYDIKETDTQIHKKYTGVPNEKIISNLFELDRQGSKIILRCIIIPGLNDRDDHFTNIGKIVGKLKNLLEINVMPYHNYGVDKGQKAGMNLQKLDYEVPDDEKIALWIETLQEITEVPVKRG